MNRYASRGKQIHPRQDQPRKLGICSPLCTGTHDVGAIQTIVNTAKTVSVAFTPNPNDPENPFPTILPMIGQMASYEYPSAGIDEPMECYLHGYVSARMSRLAQESEHGLPVCISAFINDGVILALTPFSHSYNYRSAVLHGYAKLVEDKDARLWAMEMITESIVPGRWANSRTPPDSGELSSTAILKVSVVGGSGKIRDGSANDDKKDLARDEVTERVWTGAVPVYEVYGKPIPGKNNKVEEVPKYITDYVEEKNGESEETAVGMITG